MTIATAIAGTEHGRLAKPYRFKMVKAVIAFSLVLLLMYAGFKGRQHARLQAKLEDVTVVRDHLQQKLDDDQRPAEEPVGGVRGTNTNASRPLSSIPGVNALVSALKIRLGQFESDYNQGELSEGESLEIRLSHATLANAELRFADALATITDEDEKRNSASTKAQAGRLGSVLQIRGDSFYGLHQWQEALDRYRRLLILEPVRIVTMTRIAECYAELGSRSEAITTYGELVKNHSRRGHSLVVQGKPDAAVRHYGKAIEIQTRLIEAGGRSALANDLAGSHNNRGDAFRALGKPDAALADFREAMKYALKACELSEWKDLAPVETLAAACAGSGNIADAIKWQERAVELAPAKDKAEIRAKLELYKSGNPYRTPVPIAD